MAIKTGFAAAAPGVVSVGGSTFIVGALLDEPIAEVVPPAARLTGLEVDLSAIAGATEISMQVSHDTNRDSAITPRTAPATQAISDTATLGRGTCVWSWAISYRRLTESLGPYVSLWTNAGNVTVAQVRLLFEWEV